jgi:hypothetical protein
VRHNIALNPSATRIAVAHKAELDLKYSDSSDDVECQSVNLGRINRGRS